MENEEAILRLRKKLKELESLGYMNPSSAGTYEQTILQVWQEADRRRGSCLAQAETLRRQAAAAEAQAGAFTVMASILYNVVNGFVEAGNKQALELLERDHERAQEPQPQESNPAPEVSSKKKGRAKQ